MSPHTYVTMQILWSSINGEKMKKTRKHSIFPHFYKCLYVSRKLGYESSIHSSFQFAIFFHRFVAVFAPPWMHRRGVKVRRKKAFVWKYANAGRVQSSITTRARKAAEKSAASTKSTTPNRPKDPNDPKEYTYELNFILCFSTLLVSLPHNASHSSLFVSVFFNIIFFIII